MKTPLPEKITVYTSGQRGEATILLKINDIITYLAELTEVVEGKQDNWSHIKIDADAYLVGTSGTNQQTPTLKKQLLGEIKQLSVRFNNDSNDWVVSYKDVEAIINRLIP